MQPAAWAGIDSTLTHREPPDPWVGVGPEHVVQAVNTSIQIWNRVGGQKLGPTAIASAALFNLPARFENSDPRFQYDPIHGRWLGTELSWSCDYNGDSTADDPVGFIDFVLSRTADPTGVWDGWGLEFPGYLPDYPAAGWSTDKIAFGTNLYSLQATADCASDASYVGPGIYVIDWAQVLAGIASPAVAAFEPDASLFTPRIATPTAATSAALHTVTEWFDGSSVVPYYARFTGSAAAGTVTADAEFDLAAEGVAEAYVEPPPPLQPTDDVVTTSIDSRPTDAVWQNGKLAFVSTVGCQPEGDTDTRSCVRVTEIGTNAVTPTTPPTALQDFVIGASGSYDYFGGVGYAGDGTMHVVWTRSGPAAAAYPSTMHAYRFQTDPANSLSAPVVLKAGTAPYEGTRWGDYVGVAQDPQVPNAVWQANQYSAGSAWATRISELQTTGSTYVPVSPVRVLDTRYGTGLTGQFSVNSPRSWKVAGFTSAKGSIPANAIAITGNVTVVGQTAAGYVSVTPTPVAAPKSSTINFPAADVRANNVTVPLASNGYLAAVYKAGSGQKTHLVFDVTGYFVRGTASARYSPVTPFRKIDSRTGAGMPGGTAAKFKSDVPISFKVAGLGSIPADATAVTGNLTVVNQTRGGYLSITPTATAAPPTSNLNFPVGDVRANGFTAPLSNGNLSVVYKGGSSTARTDVVMDLTGYYRPGASGLVFYPLNPGRIFDTRVTVLTGLTGRFAGGSPRKLDTGGHWGVAANAGAVTGNLTVTNQTTGGYVAITLTSIAKPPTSTLNFPVGDVRANGVTVPLDAGHDMWLVYVASTTARTHLLLDVTGYFAT